MVVKRTFSLRTWFPSCSSPWILIWYPIKLDGFKRMALVSLSPNVVWWPFTLDLYSILLFAMYLCFTVSISCLDFPINRPDKSCILPNPTTIICNMRGAPMSLRMLLLNPSSLLLWKKLSSKHQVSRSQPVCIIVLGLPPETRQLDTPCASCYGSSTPRICGFFYPPLPAIGLPLFLTIEHSIDLILGASLPNVHVVPNTIGMQQHFENLSNTIFPWYFQ